MVCCEVGGPGGRDDFAGAGAGEVVDAGFVGRWKGRGGGGCEVHEDEDEELGGNDAHFGGGLGCEVGLGGVVEEMGD